LDELTASLSFNPVDMVAVTETWFNEDIDDSLASVHGYHNLSRAPCRFSSSFPRLGSEIA
jgi:hypothetical protein